MLEGDLLQWHKVINKYNAFELLAAPALLFLLANTSLLVNFAKFGTAADWRFWFVRDEYAYVSVKYGVNVYTIFLLHAYELVICILLSTFSIRLVIGATLLGIARYKKYQRWYGPEIMPKMRDRFARVPLGIFGSLFFITILAIGGGESILFMKFDMTEPVFRLWVEKSFVTFVGMQVCVISLISMLAYYVVLSAVLILLNSRHKPAAGEVHSN